ncbi:hypothetical protein, partial [Dictyobacter arantiisoli]|uniref:hypothetical protein n=1 Tax=Dictyobacter arantiisoli TaxID=2014874 RepID=UPI0011EE58E1
MGNLFNDPRPHLIKLLIDGRFNFGHRGLGMTLAPLCNRLKGFLTFLLPTLFQVFCIHDLAHLSFGEISYYHFILPFWRRKKMNGT